MSGLCNLISSSRGEQRSEGVWSEFLQWGSACSGVLTPTIIVRHVLLNTLSSVIVMASLQIAQALLAEAA
jgi:hypothetical protein